MIHHHSNYILGWWELPRKKKNIKHWINPFRTNVPFLYLLKTSENQRFSEGIEMGHGREKG